MSVLIFIISFLLGSIYSSLSTSLRCKLGDRCGRSCVSLSIAAARYLLCAVPAAAWNFGYVLFSFSFVSRSLLIFLVISSLTHYQDAVQFPQIREFFSFLSVTGFPLHPVVVREDALCGICLCKSIETSFVASQTAVLELELCA